MSQWARDEPFRWGESRDGWKTKWRQSCLCGKVAFVYNSDPLQVKACHCRNCQKLHGAPYQQAAIFPKSSVRLDTPPDQVRFLTASSDFHPLSSSPTPLPRKISCGSCGSPFMDEGRNMIMAFPPLFEFHRGDGEAGVPEPLRVQSHIFYGQRITDVVDGKDKWEGHKDQSNKMGDHD
ncbi:hypothetical protein J010_01789 [Cryptococcus neoformans]|nr:hypothetical protein C355_01919 [Cryptococcus neoformans var. grubii Th84]OXH15039.1 hypothetical protein J010_01789 [Cryptococcus neoformans var. grubii]OXH35683.1 hypothetical protein J009_01801 [Cryptococcus neoformans var. grubii]OXH56154.1 hypothetical protein J003_01806 [Cryptococcus neoformans var. grubii]OXH56243.1 hypothetical protein J004_01840 [Cryptococcus neoformans var. grubii]